MNILRNLVVVIGAYLLGSIPMGLLLVRATTGQDVRQIGSGRTGGTNVLRAAGPWIALASGAGDVLKGLLSVWAARGLRAGPWVEALAGLAAVIGHNYSIFIGFKGGAGTATTLGGAFALWPWNGVINLVVGAAVIAATGYASVGSIVVAATIPLIFALRAWLAGAPWAYLVHGLGTMVLTLWALRPNIQRLASGTERKVSLKKGAKRDT